MSSFSNLDVIHPNSFFLDFAKFAYRYRILISILMSAWAIYCFISIGFFLQPWYKSDVKFLPPESSGGGFSIANLAGISLPNMGGDGIKAEYIQEVFESDDFAVKIINQLNLIKKYNLQKQRFPKEKAITEFRNRVKMVTSQSSGIGISDIISITIHVEDENPDSAFLICKRSYQVLDSITRDLSNALSGRRVEYIKSRLDSTEAVALDEAKQFATYQKKSKIFDLNRQLEITSNSIGELIRNINSSTAQLGVMKSMYGNDAQEVKVIERRIEEAKKQVFRFTYDTTPSITPSLTASVNAASEYESKVRELKGQMEMIRALRQQYEIEKMDAARNYSLFRVVDPPMFSKKKFRPKRLIVMPAALIGGWGFLFVGIASIYVFLIGRSVFKEFVHQIADK